MTIPYLEHYDLFFEWFVGRATALALDAHLAPLSAIDAFGWDTKSGQEMDYIARTKPPFFFRVGGVIVRRRADLSAPPYGHPVFTDETDGRIGIFLYHRALNEVIALVSCQAESGNMGYVDDLGNTRALVSPSFAFSQANLQNEKKPPLYQVLDRFQFNWKKINGEGGRSFEKVNLGARYYVNAGERDWLEEEIAALGEGAKNYAWVPAAMLRTIRDEGYAGAHLLHAMGLMY